jgi:hypothetical protein
MVVHRGIKMRYLITLTLLLAIVTCVSAQSGIYNGHEYTAVLSPLGIGYEAARAQAIQSGGHLATIENQAENEFVYNLISADDTYWYMESWGSGTGPWIGLHRVGSGWEWIDGTPVTFTNWAPSEPNQLNDNEYDVAYSGHSPAGRYLKGPYWDDMPNGKLQPGYILEKDLMSVPSKTGSKEPIWSRTEVLVGIIAAIATIIGAFISRRKG